MNGRNGRFKYRKTNKKRKNKRRSSTQVKHKKWNMRGGLPDTLYGVVVNANNSIVVLPYRQYRHSHNIYISNISGQVKLLKVTDILTDLQKIQHPTAVAHITDDISDTIQDSKNHPPSLDVFSQYHDPDNNLNLYLYTSYADADAFMQHYF